MPVAGWETLEDRRDGTDGRQAVHSVPASTAAPPAPPFSDGVVSVRWTLPPQPLERGQGR